MSRRTDGEKGLGLGPESGLPYSKGLMAQTLMATGLSPESSYRLAAALEQRLTIAGRSSVRLDDLRHISREMLGEAESAALMERLQRWRRVRTLERPLIILIGGTTGVGKSTLANQLAHRLGIVRVASTDMVRQVMRAFFARDLMPAIHSSSFDCAAAVPAPVPEGVDLTLAGFIEQVRAVHVGIEALVARAVEEKQGFIIEGVHLVPGHLDTTRWGDALVVELVVTVPERHRHEQHFTFRDWHTGGMRSLRRYLEHLDEIRRIQELIRRRAEERGVTVIENRDIDAAVARALDEVLRAVAVRSAAGSGE